MGKKTKILKLLKQYSVITLGCLINALGVALFLDPYNIAPGGVTGISIIINYVTHVPTWLLIIIINVPLFILGAIFFGWRFILSTMYSTILSSLLIKFWDWALGNFIPVTDDKLISALIGGTLFGLGLGLIFRMGSTTGGTDIIVKILRKKFRYIKTGRISMMIDLLILAASIFIINIETACYAAVSVVIMSLVFDWILYGGNSAKLVYIITANDMAGAMCEKILKELDVGATFVDGKGAYTGNDKRIIMCAIKNFLYPKLRDVVRSVDPHAFTIVTSAQEIYGEGYKDHNDDDL